MTHLDALLALAQGQDVTIPAPPPLETSPVPGEGPLDAQVCVVGESLGREEVEQRRPFVGATGKKLRNHAFRGGVDLKQVRIENVYPLFPAGGSITNVPGDEIAFWQEDCRNRLRAMPNLRLIIAVGNLSLETFTGFRDITRRRGSVYDWSGKQVYAMIDPDMFLHAKGKSNLLEKAARIDWERVSTMLPGADVRMTSRVHHTQHNTDNYVLDQIILDYKREAQNTKKILAVDIETPKKADGSRYFECISFAFSPGESLVLPYADYQQDIKDLCASPCIKLGHNLISFDRWWLQRSGIPLNGEIRDTLAIHHALDPASMHSLEYLVSRYLWEPWYKDEGQGHDATNIKDWESYYNYCGQDACCTRELHDILWPMLEARGMVPFYRQCYQALFDPILDVSTEGVDVDHEARKALLTEALKQARQARDALSERAGQPVYTVSSTRDKAVLAALSSDNPEGLLKALEGRYDKDALQKSVETINKKTVSGNQLKNILYNVLGLPEQLKRRKNGEYTATADALTLKKLRREYGEQRPEVVEIIDLALKHNKAQKLAGFCYENHFDTDGKFRFTLKVNTEAARLSSSKAPNGRGQNCLLPEAEVFTPQGWVRFDALELGTSVLQWHPSGVLDFCTPLLHCYPFDGEMITADSWFHRNAYTPNHRIPIAGFNHSKAQAIGHDLIRGLTVQEAQLAAQRNKFLLPVSGYYSTGTAKFSAIQLLVAVQADGSIESSSIRFTLSKERKIWRLLSMLFALDIPCTEQKAQEGARRFAISRSHPLVARVAAMLENNKTFSWDILHFDQQTLQMFVEETQHWDGSTRGKSWWYFSTNEKNVEIVSTIAHLCGYSATNWVNTDNNRGYGSGQNLPLHYAKVRPRCYATVERDHWSTKPYKGFVYCVTTETGFFLTRYGSVISVTGNSQNAPRSKAYRRIFLPRPGHVVLDVDASNIEGRYGMYRTGDPEMVRLARLRSTEWDDHRHTAVVVGLAPDTVSVTKDKRQVSKSITHGAWRAMQGLRLSETMMQQALDEEGNWNEEFIRTPEECDGFLELWHKAKPATRQWQQRVRRDARATKRLVAANGRIWDVSYEEMNEDLFRRAYSWLLQKDCADHMNSKGFIPLWNWLKQEGMQSRIMFHMHDGLVVSCSLDEVYDVALFLRKCLEAPIEIDGVEGFIPVEFGLGRSWAKEGGEWAILPERGEFERIAKGLVDANS